MTETDGKLLARLGTDGALWAAEFVARLDKIADASYEVSGAHEDAWAVVSAELDATPGSWLHGWFVNMLEAGRSAATPSSSADVEPHIGRFSAMNLERLALCIREELDDRECARAGHPPAQVISADEGAISAYCRCGKATWSRTERT